MTSEWVCKQLEPLQNANSSRVGYIYTVKIYKITLTGYISNVQDQMHAPLTLKCPLYHYV